MNKGETIGILILGSDKTHLTNYQGDKECHNVFITCGNIKKEIRNKASARAWMHVGQIPVVKWEDRDLQGILTQRLFHECHDIILGGAKKCSFQAEKMVGPDGYLYNVQIFCGGDISDHPEQSLLAVRKGSASPLSEADHNQLGDSFVHPLRTRDKILATIQEARKLTEQKAPKPADPDLPTYMEDMKKYLKRYATVAKELGLNGVENPFWQDWYQADPSVFLVPDPLHQWFKLFEAHIFEWAKSLLGNAEIDRRLQVLQPMVGYRHFTNGITRFHQHTCRETRDLMRYFIGIICGHQNITGDMMKMFRAFVDYVYIGQYESHSPETLGYLKNALDRFHTHKHTVGFLRDGPLQKQEFHIPKIEKMHHPLRLIPLVGTAPQYSTEPLERCHITHAKIPFKSTNKKEYASQMCRYSDRQAKLFLFDDYLQWELSEGEICIGDEEVGDDEMYQDEAQGVQDSREVDPDNAVDQASTLRNI